MFCIPKYIVLWLNLAIFYVAVSSGYILITYLVACLKYRAQASELYSASEAPGAKRIY